MNLGDFLKTATDKLTTAGVETARLDCLILLEDSFERDRAYLLAHPEIAIPKNKLDNLNALIAERATHMPLAYIRGKAMFYGREFVVNEYTLVPRPETESLITLLKSVSLPDHAKLADIGTGSGCIGITASLEVPGSEVWLADIDPAALVVAGGNLRRHNVRGHCLESDLLSGLPAETFDVILANLPYVPEIMAINKAATFEPRLALFAGPDGLDAYKRFWQQVGSLPHKAANIIIEALPSQHHALAMLARAAGYYLAETNGFGQLFQLL